MKKFYLVAFLFFLMTSLAHAFSKEDLKFSGYLQDSTYYFAEQDDKFVAEILANLKTKANFTKELSFYSEFEGRYNSLGLEREVFVEGGDYRPYLGAEQFYFDYSKGKAEFSLGIEKVNWGIADRFNPIDLINPVDYTDLVRSRKIGQPLISFSYYPISQIQIETIVAPIFLPSRLPPEDSYFYIDVGEMGIEKKIHGTNLGEFQFGLRIKGQYQGLELTGIAYKGVDHLPFIEFDPINNELIYKYQGMSALGGGFEYAVGKFVFRGEGAYYFYDDKEIEGQNYGAYVLGIDYNLGQIFKSYNLYANMQYIGENPKKEDLTWVHHLFTDAVSTKLLLSNSFFESSIEGVYNFPNSGLILIPAISYSYKSWKFAGEYNYFAGEKGSYWDYNKKSQNFLASVRYSF
jgi:hypothetical protein